MNQCPACGSTRLTPAGQQDGYDWHECARCGTTAVDPAQLKGDDLYDDLYAHSFGVVEPGARLGLQETVAALEPFRVTGRWMDLGFGQGALLDVAEQAGWLPFGVETAPSALAAARGRGWTVCDPASLATAVPHGGFDVVSLVEVIEHVPAGRLLLESAMSLLRPGGALYMTTPNGRSLNRRWLGLRWSIFCAPDHVAIWTAGGARVALRECGFEVRDVRTTGLNPGELRARAARASASAAVTHRNTTGAELNSAIAARPWARHAKNVVNEGLSALGIGDTLKILAVKPLVHEEGHIHA